MKVYVCGIIANGGRLQPHEVGANCDALDAATVALRAVGYTVVNPIELHSHPTELEVITPELSRSRLRVDIAQLTTCDAICPRPGWHASEGARLEMMVARGLGLEELPWPLL